jgi:hypothetical protein
MYIFMFLFMVMFMQHGHRHAVYGVCLLDTRRTSVTKKVRGRPFCTFNYLYMVVCDLYALLAALILPTECQLITAPFLHPVPFLLGGFLGEGEAGQLALHCWLTHQK